MRMTIAVIALFSGCGDSLPPPVDVGMDAPERCARTRDQFRECGVCIEPHATLLGTTSLDARLYPIEGGVLFAFQTRLTVVFVNDAGEMVDSLSHDPELGSDWSWLEPVPDSRLVWGIVNQRGGNPDRSEDVSDLVLFEVSSSALTRLASVQLLTRVGVSTVLDTGELLFSAHADLIDNGSLTRCIFQDGEIQCSNLGGTEHVLTKMWSLTDGKALVVTSESGPLAGRGDAWTYVADRTGVISGPTPIHADASPEYEDGGEPKSSNGFAIHRDRTATVLLSGTHAAMEASPSSHHFVRRIDAEGAFVDAAPGIWINPDQFPLIWDEPEPRPGSIRRAPNNQTYVAWDSFDIETSTRVPYFQLLEPSGELRLAEARRADGPGSRATGFIDGSDQAFGHFSVLTESNPERPFEARFGANLASDDDLEYVWDEPLYYQECERVDEQAKVVSGAYDDGLWVVWQDVVVGEVDGLPYTQLKIARIMPDGDFGWRFDE